MSATIQGGTCSGSRDRRFWHGLALGTTQTTTITRTIMAAPGITAAHHRQSHCSILLPGTFVFSIPACKTPAVAQAAATCRARNTGALGEVCQNFLSRMLPASGSHSPDSALGL
ncbi:hypothetical protein SK803_01990 [Lentzea sp. BCCO 10_0856]|uniref:Uncharacterized protein n=1 Tax=Lentzea miocenica TaxID=3095431 RepID=A0ABU4ST65_9PSEU|nr:hypothetical protein [Lentzea sp. BCCO 10_0856]MDX8028958.1 hypothetical protein [Lentzea sp. BCCO 10_0856]